MSTQMSKLVASGKIGKYKDSKTNIKIKVSEIDVIRGGQFKPDSCVLAKASCRSVPNALKTWFYRHAAYIAMWDPKQQKQVTLRFIPSEEARGAIEKFDKTGKFTPGVYTLLAPSGSASLKQIRQRAKKRPGRHQKGSTAIKRKPKATSKGRLSYAMAY